MAPWLPIPQARQNLCHAFSFIVQEGPIKSETKQHVGQRPPSRSGAKPWIWVHRKAFSEGNRGTEEQGGKGTKFLVVSTKDLEFWVILENISAMDRKILVRILETVK